MQSFYPIKLGKLFLNSSLEGNALGVVRFSSRTRRRTELSMEPIRLDSFDSFCGHQWVQELVPKCKRARQLASHAVRRMVGDVERTINVPYCADHGRVAFTTVEGRAKTVKSTLRKLYAICLERAPSEGTSKETIAQRFAMIQDICGVRFSCPYYDEVEKSIADLIRPRLTELGYATDLGAADTRYSDKNMLDNGDDHGYRSYHFYVKVPTPVDIYGDVEMCLCEVQARTELQHVWAVKSHDLLYKPKDEWQILEGDVEDMRQVSNSLRAADQFLVSIRKRVEQRNQ